MYLVVILATFVSAIYGFNLSARPDYDRDIPRKKAASLIFRFVHQHNIAVQVLRRVKHHDEGYETPLYILPNDLLYGDLSGSDDKDYTMVYDQTHPSANDGDGVSFLLRSTDNDPDANDYMQEGLRLLDGHEMASKVICIDRLMTCVDDDTDNHLCKARDGSYGKAKSCEVEVDPSDPSIITGTCCLSSHARGGIYLVSFMKLDARWKGRVTGTLNYDFWHAVEGRSYGDNIGVIVWENGAWQFSGKMYFGPSYTKDMEDWYAEHPDSVNEPFPLYKKLKTNWTLPIAIFDKNFFKVRGVDYCEKGCLFQIKAF